jgi:hypothetical protein
MSAVSRIQIVCLKRKIYGCKKWVEKTIRNAVESHVYVCLIDVIRFPSGQLFIYCYCYVR